MELIVKDTINSTQVFLNGEYQPVFNRVTEMIESFEPDTSTKKGRDAIRSFAFKIAKAKSFLDKKGQELNDGKKAEIKDEISKISTNRKKVYEFFETTQATVRLPLTTWEKEEEERVKYITDTIAEIQGLADTTGLSSVEIEGSIKAVNTVFITSNFEELENEADIAKDNTLRVLDGQFELVKKQEEDQAELERLRQEAEKREQEDKEKAAVLEAQRIADENERIEKERAEREKKESERLAKEAAERATREAEEKAKTQHDIVEYEKQEAIEAKEAAERKAKEAEEKAEREAELATLRERERVESERKAEEEKVREREADEKHRAEIKTRACKALCLLKGISEEKAATVFDYIANGEVPHIKVIF